MAAVIICMASFLYAAVFFLKNIRHKIAALFFIDGLVLGCLFFMAAPAHKTVVFILSAAALNITVFFLPQEEPMPASRPLDFVLLFANVFAASAAAIYVLMKGGAAFTSAALPAPAVTAFLFMALSVAGFFLYPEGGGDKK